MSEMRAVVRRFLFGWEWRVQALETAPVFAEDPWYGVSGGWRMTRRGAVDAGQRALRRQESIDPDDGWTVVATGKAPDVPIFGAFPAPEPGAGY